MVIDIIHFLLADVEKLCTLAAKTGKQALGDDYDHTVIVEMYNRNRGRIFDIVREMDLGARVEMTDLELQFPPAQYGNLK